MIAMWMLYSLLVTTALVAAGVAFDYLVRLCRGPTRAVWAGVMGVALSLSLVSLVLRVTPGPASGSLAAGTTTMIENGGEVRHGDGPGPSGNGAAAVTLRQLLAGTRSRLADLGVRLGANETRWQQLDVPLLVIWAVMSMFAILLLGGSLAHLRRVERTLAPAVIEHVPVLLSHDLGPALLGLFQFRVVLPRWAQELPEEERRTVLAHEREHARAGDPALLIAATVAVALQPWNAALWGAFTRLRFATEADCDARILGARSDVANYGALLLKIYERR